MLTYYIRSVASTYTMLYYIDMATTNQYQLNRLEQLLQDKLSKLMFDENVKFSVFIPVLRFDMPEDKNSDEYKKKYRATYLKHLRASFSVEEVRKMLNVLGYDLRLTLDDKEVVPVKYSLAFTDIKVRYIDFMATCELLGIDIDWIKRPIEHPKTSKL